MSGTDPRFLRHYNNELAYLRRHASEFAEDHQQVAGRLGLDAPTDPDPHVERLLEGVAYLNARVRLKLEDQYPVFTQHLMNALYPDYVRPTPSMGIVALKPQRGDEKLAEGVVHPRGSSVFIEGEDGIADRIEFRTGMDVTIWPIEVERVDYYATRAAAASKCGAADAEAALKIRLRTTASISFADIPLKSLDFFVAGERSSANALFEQLMTCATGVSLAPVVDEAPDLSDLRRLAGLKPIGFGPDEALLPESSRSFRGYRVLKEYFSMPEKFRYFRVRGFERSEAPASDAIDIIVELNRSDPPLGRTVDRSQLQLFTTPIINLFERPFDRIRIDERADSYRVLPDRARLSATEVYSIHSVTAYRKGDPDPLPVLPLYARRPETGAKPLYYTTEHKMRKLSEAQQRRRRERDYVGSEVWLSLAAPNDPALLSEIEEIALRGRVTNRSLPTTVRPGAGGARLELADQKGVDGLSFLSGPTTPHPPLGLGDDAWRIVGHLSPGVNGFVREDGSPEVLAEHLSLYLHSEQSALRREVQGISRITSEPVTRRAESVRPMAFVRGRRVTLFLAASSYEANSAYLFSSIVGCFLESFATVNSFAEVAVVVDDGRTWDWPVRPGAKPII